MKPLLKWAGGKSRVVPSLIPLLPKDWETRTYYEPFLGSGALFFALKPKRARLSDANARLIQMYREIAEDPERVLAEIERARALPYEELRTEFNARPSGAALLVLNKTCFNGVYRVNAKGAFNVPKGSFASEPKVVDPLELLQASERLRAAELRCESYLLACVRAEHPRAFVYLDPPYDNSWTGYTAEGFDAADQEALRDACIKLDTAGACWMLSNHDTPLIRELYRGFHIAAISVRRSVGRSRANASEIVITNYESS